MSEPRPRLAALLRRRPAGGWLPVRVVVTMTLVAIVASQIDWHRMGSRFSHGRPLYFLAAIGFVVAALGVGAMRWSRLLNRAGLPLGPFPLARIYAIATFSNTFLPTSVGGDVTRALLVTRRGSLLARTALTIVVDRAGGLAGLLGMAWIAFAVAPTNVPHGARAFLLWVTVAVVVVSSSAIVAVFHGKRLARAVIPQRLWSGARMSRSLLRGYVGDPRTIALVLALSLLYQALISLQLVMLAHAINVHLAFATAAVVLTLVTIVTLIPISIGGFGIREGSYVVLLGGVSIAATDATLISVLSVAALFFASLPGAVLLMRGGIAPELETAPALEATAV